MKTLLTSTAMFIMAHLGAQQALDPQTDRAVLFKYAEWAGAGQERLTLEEALDGETLRFQSLPSGNHALGFTSDTYWVRFRLRNTSKSRSVYYLETARPVTDEARLYQTGPQGVREYRSGDQTPFTSRAVPHRATVFRLELPAESDTGFYLELRSDGETLNLPLGLYTEGEFLSRSYTNQLFLGFFYGMLLLAGIIYLFFYRSLKEKSFLYYGLYVFSIFLLQACLDGFFFQYVLPGGGYWNDRAVLLSALVCNACLLKYCEHFLKVRERLPVLHRVFRWEYVFLAVLAGWVLLGASARESVYPMSNINGLLSLLLILVTVLTLWYRMVRVDPFFTAGICFLVIGLLGFVLNNLSVLPNTFLTLHSAKFGSGLEVIFLSLSMTNLLRDLRLDKERSQEAALQKSREISEMKSFFMSNMSHELRTPLNLIMGITEEQLRSGPDSEMAENYRLIRDASTSLLSNINDVLDFEKMEKNELVLRSEVFNPAVALGRLCEHWAVQAHRKGLDFRFNLDPDLPLQVRADRHRLSQVVNNLLSNAVKFTSRGEVWMQLKSHPQPGGRCLFLIQVGDTGIGISSEKRPHIFDSFNQMRLDDRRKFGGIGLGLCIVKYLVDAFGGIIRLESEPARGTEVFVELPLEVCRERAVAKSPETRPVRPEAPMRVLVVEDNRMNQLVMKKLLKGIPGVEHEMAGNGFECLERLRESAFDLILMDLQMPVMDGYEATRAIRDGKAGPQLADLPILAVTADTTEGARGRVLEAGMQGYLSKPVDPGLLADQIATYRSIKSLAS